MNKDRYDNARKYNERETPIHKGDIFMAFEIQTRASENIRCEKRLKRDR